jgi:DUF2934 family protein
MKSTAATAQRQAPQPLPTESPGALGLEREERAKIPQTSVHAKLPAEARADRVSHQNIEDQIRDRAYTLYVKRGYREGYAEQDWLDAELELLANR